MQMHRLMHSMMHSMMYSVMHSLMHSMMLRADGKEPATAVAQCY